MPPPEELSDESAQILRKIRRLMLLSLVGTALAIGVVLIIVGYRISRNEDSAVSRDATVLTPKGARIVSTELRDTGLIVTLQIGDRMEVRVHNPRTLRLERRIEVRPEL